MLGHLGWGRGGGVKFWSRDFFSELAALRKSSNSELGTPVLLN